MQPVSRTRVMRRIQRRQRRPSKKTIQLTNNLIYGKTKRTIITNVKFFFPSGSCCFVFYTLAYSSEPHNLICIYAFVHCVIEHSSYIYSFIQGVLFSLLSKFCFILCVFFFIIFACTMYCTHFSPNKNVTNT